MKQGITNKTISKAPSPSPSPAGGEGKNIAPPLRGGDKGEGDLCGFTNELLSNKRWAGILIISAIIILSAVSAFADTATFTYDDSNHFVREEYGEKTAATPSNPAANISVSPVSLDFGSVTVNESSTAQTFTVLNTGTANLVIGNISLTGTNASDFSKPSDNCTGKTIAPSSNCTIQVTFSPKSSGPRKANLSIASNDPDMPTFTVPLSGVGETVVTYTITASAGTNGTVSPSGDVIVSSDSSQTFTISPISGYQVENVVVDGVSRGAITTYTFSDITADHTISATFSVKADNREKSCN